MAVDVRYFVPRLSCPAQGVTALAVMYAICGFLGSINTDSCMCDYSLIMFILST